MSVRIIARVQSSTLGAVPRSVLSVLADWANDEGEGVLSKAPGSLAHRAGVTSKRVEEELNSFVERRILQLWDDPHSTGVTLFTIHSDALRARTEPPVSRVLSPSPHPEPVPEPVKEAKVSRYEYYMEHWRVAYSGELALGKVERANIRTLEDTLTEARCHAAFKQYLMQTEGRYASIGRFLATIGVYLNEDDREGNPAGGAKWK